MPFPERRRVIYQKNPLESVICQLRFPSVLRIDTELPSAFQENIRKDFPNFLEGTEFQIEFPVVASGQIPSDMPRQIVQPTIKNYEFASEDGQWKINLTRSFIALTTTKYNRWEEFKTKLAGPLDAFMKIYSPDYYIRVGLRYIDIFRRSTLELDGVSWEELLQPYILGMLSASDVMKEIKNSEFSK